MCVTDADTRGEEKKEKSFFARWTEQRRERARSEEVERNVRVPSDERHFFFDWCEILRSLHHESENGSFEHCFMLKQAEEVKEGGMGSTDC
jgi:hypothetical protein